MILIKCCILIKIGLDCIKTRKMLPFLIKYEYTNQQCLFSKIFEWGDKFPVFFLPQPKLIVSNPNTGNKVQRTKENKKKKGMKLSSVGQRWRFITYTCSFTGIWHSGCGSQQYLHSTILHWQVTVTCCSWCCRCTSSWQLSFVQGMTLNKQVFKWLC